MVVAYGVLVHDGPHLKQFTVTALENDGAGDLAVTFNGGLNPTAFDATKLTNNALNLPLFVASVTRNSVGANQTSQWGVHTITRTGCVVRKITGAGGANPEAITVTIDARHSIGQ
jgi:hypothetical protein